MYAVYGLVYVLFFLFDKEWAMIARMFSRWLWRYCKKKNKEEESLEDDFSKERKPGAYLTIFMYFVQVPALLKVEIEYRKEHPEDRPRDEGLKNTSERVGSIFQFDSLGLTVDSKDSCLIEGITPVEKVLFNAGFIFYLFAVLLLLYVVSITVRMTFRCGKFREEGCGATRLPISARFIGAFIILILYTFEFLSESLFSLLTCEKIYSLGEDVLVLDGTISCYQDWQWGVIGVICVYIVPMFMVLTIAPVLLREHKIRVAVFIISLVLPLILFPYLFYLYIRYCTKKKKKTEEVPEEQDKNAEPKEVKRYGSVNLVVQLVAEPYKIDKMKGLCWEGIVIFRRLVLVVIATQVTNIVERQILLVIACLLAMVTHVKIKPFKKSSSNLLESVSLTLLLGIAVMNFGKAVYFDSGEVPLGYANTIYRIYDIVENILVSILPLVLLGFVIFCIVLRVLFLPLELCGKKKKTIFTQEEENATSYYQAQRAVPVMAGYSAPVNGRQSGLSNASLPAYNALGQQPMITHPQYGMGSELHNRFSGVSSLGDITKAPGFSAVPSHGQTWGTQYPYQLAHHPQSNVVSENAPVSSVFVSGHSIGSPFTIKNK